MEFEHIGGYYHEQSKTILRIGCSSMQCPPCLIVFASFLFVNGLRVVSDFAIPAKYARARENGLPRGDEPRGEAPLLVARLLTGAHFRARVYFTGIAKIRDYSQSICK